MINEGMYGSRSRESMRQAVRMTERTSSNAEDYVSRAYNEMCTKRKMIPKLEESLMKIQKRMSECMGPASIQNYLCLKVESNAVSKEISDIRDGSEARMFFERSRPLLRSNRTDDGDPNDEQKREALAMALFHPNKAVPVFIQTDRCTSCNVDLEMREDEGVMVCPMCSRSSKYLQLSTDHVDVDYVAQDTHANHVRSTPTGNVDNMSDPDSSYPKLALYHKFLLQFSGKVPSPPTDVIDIILRELSKVHIHHSTKVQRTPISNILRKHQLKEWSWMSMRISMMIKCKTSESVPVFSDELIARMLERFKMLIDAFKAARTRNRKKVYNFWFITKVFLYQEGEYGMSEMFDNHKTRVVQRREDRRMGAACRILEKDMKKEGFGWKYFRNV